MNKKNSFGCRLKQLREANNISQLQLANILKTTPQSIGRYEKDEREPKFGTVMQIADYFGVPTDYLFGKTDINSYTQDCFFNNLEHISNKSITDAINNLPSFLHNSAFGLVDTYFEPLYGFIADRGIDKLHIIAEIVVIISRLESERNNLYSKLVEDPSVDDGLNILFKHSVTIEEISKFQDIYTKSIATIVSLLNSYMSQKACKASYKNEIYFSEEIEKNYYKSGEDYVNSNEDFYDKMNKDTSSL